MCGILGIASTAPAIAADRLAAMCETVRHRGPDDEGVWQSDDRRIGFAHRRLSVIDLSKAAAQPMASRSGRVHVTFNGEIYNYRELRRELEQLGRRFRTSSDTEVLLEAYEQWGSECLHRLNGMFAFGLFDQGANRLLLARDRAGEKPLFYTRTGQGLMFASELKALLADERVPRRLNREALEHYLAFGYVPGGMCLLDGIFKLPQGHALSYDLDAGRERVWPYWDLPAAPRDAAVEDDEAGDPEARLEALLEDAVRLRLVADVPIGIMLSGGVDSSLVTAMAARAAGAPVRTFTISFPGHGRYDEAPHARAVAAHFGTDHVELVAEPATIALLPGLARQFDEPIADSSMLPTYLVSRQIRQHATVALGGDGADELFGGYPHYSWLLEQSELRRWMPMPVRAAVGGAGRRLPLGVRGRNYVVGVGLDGPGSIAQFNLYFDRDARRRLLRAPAVAAAPEAFKEALCRHGASILQQATEVDFKTYLVDDILVKVDRASMLASLEVRAPWLDPRLIAFAFTLPDRLRATTRSRKVLLRRLARRLLPPGFDERRKQGFSLPLDAWFRGDWGRLIEDVLREADRSLFDPAFIDGLLEAQRRGRGNTQRLFALTFFELWRREYRVGAG